MIRYKSIIGRSEIIDFPDLLLSEVPAKADTGAYSSAIHATDIKELNHNGKKSLHFKLLSNHPVYKYSRDIKVDEYYKKVVENSFGQKQERYTVVLRVRLGGKKFKAEFTLTDRTVKPFPVLLGRTLLNKRFIVDSSLSNINRKELKEALTKWSNDNKDSDEDLAL